MANEFSIIIDEYHVKEVRCKNDNCRNLFGYENVKIGVMIFRCPNCGHINTFRMGYNQKGEFIKKLSDKFEPKGGEN